jgi:hypothetical protein
MTRFQNFIQFTTVISRFNASHAYIYAKESRFSAGWCPFYHHDSVPPHFRRCKVITISSYIAVPAAVAYRYNSLRVDIFVLKWRICPMNWQNRDAL